MIILDNTTSSKTIYLRLGDKFTPNGEQLSLVLYRIEEGNKAYSFAFTPTISTNGVYSITINPSSLPSSDYKAAVLQGLPDAIFPNCQILSDATISNDSDSACDPLVLEAVLTFDAMLVLTPVLDTVIWQGRARVQGVAGVTYTTPTIEPTYIVYEG